jgi:PAS domain S-box-containing protein
MKSEKMKNQLVDLPIAVKGIAFKNEEKENRAAELAVANKELIFQNEEKEKRAAELIIANKELAFQNEEKEKRAAELIIANKELIFQNEEKENRAAELIIANKELAFQNKEKENRAAELSAALEKVSFLATIADNIQDPVIAYDNNYLISNWNQAAEKLLEWKSEEVLGKRIDLILNVNYSSQSREQILASFQQKGSWQGEIDYHAKSGKRVNVLITASTLKDSQGNLTGNVILAKDITERKKADERLIEFEHFFNNNNDLCGIANQVGLFETINANFIRVLGYSEKEFCETPFIEFVHPDDVAETLLEYDKLKSGIHVINFIDRFRKKNGNYIYLDWNATPNPITGKLYCVARDITERKKAEDEIIKANKRFSSIFTFSPIAISITSIQDGLFLYVNEAFCKTTGYKRDDLIGKKSVDVNIIGSEAREKSIAQILIPGGQGKDIEGALKKPNGDILEVLYRVEKIEIDDEQCFASALVDITERKQAEAAIQTVNKELESFSYSVSHDLRAPLRAIHGYSNLLKAGYETKLDAEGNRLMNNIVNNSKKMGQLIDDLLAFSRIGRHELVKMNISMNSMVTNICNELKNEHPNRNIQFQIKPLLTAQADNSSLKQVWLNLISNAIKYSRHKEKSIIEISSKIKDDEIVYHIKDNGAGFDMRYADKLFGVFQRLHSDHEFEGTGVGLAIVQRIIFKHGGKVWAQGEVNHGATFYFTLNKP